MSGSTSRWRRGTFTITTRVEHDDMNAKGHLSPSGRWGLYRVRSFWNVTHIPTGLAATHSPANLDVTKQWLDRIDDELGPVQEDESAIGVDAFKRRMSDAIQRMPLPGVGW